MRQMKSWVTIAAKMVSLLLICNRLGTLVGFQMDFPAHRQSLGITAKSDLDLDVDNLILHTVSFYSGCLPF